jgi:hypothetical protein
MIVVSDTDIFSGYELPDISLDNPPAGSLGSNQQAKAIF